jgi:hypothetical protein
MDRRGEHRPNTTYTAPVGSIDLHAFREDGTAYEVWPCQECLPWHVEVIQDEGEVMVREWHAVDCARFQESLAD